MYHLGLILLLLIPLIEAEPTRLGKLRGPGTRRGSGAITTTTTTTTASPLVKSGISLSADTCVKPYSCLNCTTFQICVPSGAGFTVVYSGSCPSDRPYCDDYSGTCVNSISVAAQCSTPDESFICMKNGSFPHPSDPSKYYICSNLKAYAYSCQEGQKYYAPNKGCANYVWINTPFDCVGQNASKVSYSSGGMYYAYCVSNKPYIVSSCEEREFFNATSQVCEPQCSRETSAPDSNYCNKYFKCTKLPNSSYERDHLTCPSGEGFDPESSKCISLQSLPKCSDMLRDSAQRQQH